MGEGIVGMAGTMVSAVYAFWGRLHRVSVPVSWCFKVIKLTNNLRHEF
jgi:hypothetical protein